MSSSSDSSLELHDINWDEDEDLFFDYHDPLSLSPQLAAVLANDVAALRNLLQSGKSVNINDNVGNTPLHVAVVKNKKEAFDFLMEVDDIRIDADNFRGLTPLMLALLSGADYYSLALLKKGADVNVSCSVNDTCLHYAINSSPEIVQTLIEKGASVNAQNFIGETPLHLACTKGKVEIIHILLYSKADPLIPDSNNILPFCSSLSSCPEDVQQLLFDYTFNSDQNVISLRTLMMVMKAQSPFFNKLIENSRVMFISNDIIFLMKNLFTIKPELFRQLIDRHRCVVIELFRIFDPIPIFIKDYKTDFLDFFHMLCDTQMVRFIIRQHKPGNYLKYLNYRDVSEDALTDILFCLLSDGYNLSVHDLNIVYKRYGFGNLFKLLLHMDIVDIHFVIEKYDIVEFLLPRLIYDINSTIDLLYEISPEIISEHSYPLLRKFFKHPQLTECSKLKNETIVSCVPSLLELSRNRTRQYLIKKYKIKNNVQFFALLKWFPLCETYKAILSYEKTIYP